MQLDDADHERYLALPDDDDAGNRHTGVLVPVDATWPLHCDLPMWWRGGSVREFYCDCGHHRAPKRSEVREAGRA